MRTTAQLQGRWLAGGDTPERRALFARHFASGAPRKLRAACARLPLERSRVLDLGCGPGVYLAHFGPGSLGLDQDPGALALARSLGLEVEPRELDRPGWSRGLPRFDYVWLCDLLMHLEEPAALLAEVRALLEPRARLVVCDWFFPERGLAAVLARAVPGARAILEHPQHRRHFSRAQLEALLDCAGFRLEASWVHSFEQPLVARAVHSFWPAQSFLAKPH